MGRGMDVLFIFLYFGDDNDDDVYDDDNDKINWYYHMFLENLSLEYGEFDSLLYRPSMCRLSLTIPPESPSFP